jgi:hypothetical protein
MQSILAVAATIQIMAKLTSQLFRLHAFWDGFQTIGSAPSQIQDAFSTLRQGLYEEREYLKRIRRRKGGHNSKGNDLYAEGGPNKVISDAVKDLIKQFKDYEAPFLMSPHTGREKDLEWSFDATQQYYRCDLIHRILWLRVKGGILDIANKLQLLQTRSMFVLCCLSCIEDYIDIER